MGNRALTPIFGLRSDQAVNRKQTAAVGPDFRALESRLRRQVPELGYRVFVRVLGMDRFAGVEGEAVRADVHRLPGERYQVHLDAARSGVVEGIVREAPQVEVSAQLAIDAPEQVQVEGRGDALRVVVGGVQDVGVLLQ